MPRALFTWTLLLPCLLAAAPRAASAAAIAPEPVKIILVAKGGRKVPKDGEDGGPTRAQYRKAWKKVCDQLGEAMTAGRGPWGFGVFSKVACFRGKTRVGGLGDDAAWDVSVVDGEREVSVAVAYTAKAGRVEVARLKLPPSRYLFQFFDDDEFTDAVAFALLQQMPFAMKVADPLKGRHWRAGLAKDFKYAVPDPPEELRLYRVGWDAEGGRWRSQVIGSAKRGKINAPRPKKTEKSTILVGGDVTYEIAPGLAEALKRGDVWAQDARGPDARGKEMAKITKDAALTLAAQAENGSLLAFLKGTSGDLLSNLFKTAAVGYVGLRYGLEVLPGNDLLKKTHIFSLLVEIRGGPLKGLRYYYDKLPAAEQTQKGDNGSTVQSSIAWSRHVIGYSFGVSPGFLIDRLTIDPKLGVWRFNATLPVPNDADPGQIRVEQFSLGNTFSLALEAGAELLSSWYTLRGWYAIDGGYSLLKTGGTVSSNRFGADAFFTAGPTFPILGIPFKTALLAFYVYESVNVSTGKNRTLKPGEVAIASVPYSAGYAGGGVLFTW